MSFLVLGAGAVGGVIGARLYQCGQDVTLVARGQHFEAIRSDGLMLESPEGSTRFDVPVVNHPARIRIGEDTVVLLCVKSQDNGMAVEALAGTAQMTTPVVCVQNGVANERTALRFFSNVYAVAVMCPAAFIEPGVVGVYSAPVSGILDIGTYPAGVDDTCVRVAEVLRGCGFVSEAREDIMRWKYRKLVINLGNAAVALCGPEARRGRVTELAMAEGEQVLQAAGIDHISSEEDHIRRGDHLTMGSIGGQPRPGGSMWQSLARRVGSAEVDYLNGEIILLGRLHGVPTPVNELLQKLTREAASQLLPPGEMTERDILQLLPQPQ